MSLDTHPGPRDGNGVLLYWLAGLTALIGLGFAAWPALDSMNPAADVANPVTRVDLTKIAPGERMTVHWRGYPIYIVHRTPEQIQAVRVDDNAEMPFPQSDRERVQRDEWLVVVALCWHAFVPWGQELDEPVGKWGGLLCHHGDAYDLSGRLRTRWGEANFEIPPYYFESNNSLVIGDTS